MLEKSVLIRSKNPFVVKLKYSFQTDQKLYLVMEYVTGGQLSKILSKYYQNRFIQVQAQFCVAEVVLELEYIHETLKVVYRDLKPYNILVTQDGHLKLTDFGLLKQYDKQDMRFFTVLISLLAYLSTLKSGHNTSVDQWSLGILLYEMLVGYTPFRDKSNNLRMIENKIIQNQIVFPDFISTEATDILLLNKDPHNRLDNVNLNSKEVNLQIKQRIIYFVLKLIGMIFIVYEQNHQFQIVWPRSYHKNHQKTKLNKKKFETPQSQIRYTHCELEGFSVNHDEQ